MGALHTLKVVAFDVDGVLTDGWIDAPYWVGGAVGRDHAAAVGSGS